MWCFGIRYSLDCMYVCTFKMQIMLKLQALQFWHVASSSTRQLVNNLLLPLRLFLYVGKQIKYFEWYSPVVLKNILQPEFAVSFHLCGFVRAERFPHFRIVLGSLCYLVSEVCTTPTLFNLFLSLLCLFENRLCFYCAVLLSLTLRPAEMI